MFREESERVVLERWPEGEGLEVRFKLVVRGHLPPEKRGVADTKQRIRRELHPQLRELYRHHPNLGVMRESWTGKPVVDLIADQYERCGFRFVPIVREANKMAVSLDILLLRREEPNRVFNGSGDLDGRVKTLLDGLKMPTQLGDVKGDVPGSDDDPFFCLLEDDRLVFDFQVTTDRLLIPPDPGEPERDVLAIIGVHVKNFSGDDLAVLSHGFGPG